MTGSSRGLSQKIPFVLVVSKANWSFKLEAVGSNSDMEIFFFSFFHQEGVVLACLDFFG